MFLDSGTQESDFRVLKITHGLAPVCEARKIQQNMLSFSKAFRQQVKHSLNYTVMNVSDIGSQIQTTQRLVPGKKQKQAYDMLPG